MKLLSQLTVVGDVSREAYIARLDLIKKEGNQFVIVLEDPQRPPVCQVVASSHSTWSRLRVEAKPTFEWLHHCNHASYLSSSFGGL
jgi:hypothetical protein